ncbi:MAG: hypothetical protein AVDCRST_MAG19-1024, partial [uncultured Thermomicrobiales bacterium]
EHARRSGLAVTRRGARRRPARPRRRRRGRGRAARGHAGGRDARRGRELLRPERGGRHPGGATGAGPGGRDPERRPRPAGRAARAVQLGAADIGPALADLGGMGGLRRADPGRGAGPQPGARRGRLAVPLQLPGGGRHPGTLRRRADRLPGPGDRRALPRDGGGGRLHRLGPHPGVSRGRGHARDGPRLRRGVRRPGSGEDPHRRAGGLAGERRAKAV